MRRAGGRVEHRRAIAELAVDEEERATDPQPVIHRGERDDGGVDGRIPTRVEHARGQQRAGETGVRLSADAGERAGRVEPASLDLDLGDRCVGRRIPVLDRARRRVDRSDAGAGARGAGDGEAHVARCVERRAVDRERVDDADQLRRPTSDRIARGNVVRDERSDIGRHEQPRALMLDAELIWPDGAGFGVHTATEPSPNTCASPGARCLRRA